MAIPHKKLDQQVIHKVVIRTPQKCTVVQDGGGRTREVCETETEVTETVVRTPKIVTHRQKKKGSKGAPMKLNVKEYPKKEMDNNPEHKKLRDDTVDEADLDKCGSGHGGGKGGDDKKKKRMAKTPKKKKNM